MSAGKWTDERLKQLAEAEDGCIVSVGGLVGDIEQLAALRRRVLDMALGAFGVFVYDPNVSLHEQGGWITSTSDVYRLIEAVIKAFDVNHLRRDIWDAPNLNAIVAALYAAGERA